MLPMLRDEIERRRAAIYRDYLEIVCPYIVQLEVMDSEYPIEVFNEIRAITTHLARLETDLDDSSVEYNLNGAESHIKRAILDCYKYLCVSYREKYDTFSSLYKNVDLSFVDNGDFLVKLLSYNKDISKLVREVKVVELANSKDARLYDLYEKAFQLSDEMGSFIDDSLEKCNLIKMRTQRRVTKDRVIAVVGLIIGIVGVLITLIGR